MSVSEAWQYFEFVVPFALQSPNKYAEASKFVHFGVQMSIISKYQDDCDNNN